MTNELRIDDRQKNEHSSFAQVTKLLKMNDFSEKYIGNILERMENELSMEILNDFNEIKNRITSWIGESISFYKEQPCSNKGRIIVLIGPAGVGKTTTIAKLAANFYFNDEQEKITRIRLITTDDFHIAAKAQFENLKRLDAYGFLIGIPVSHISNENDLEKYIAKNTAKIDLFLIDTCYKSMNSDELLKMKELLNVCGKEAEIHLVISAHTKTNAIEEFLQAFSIFNYRSVVLTKMDETGLIGDIISILADKGISVSYITNGQKIPRDIEMAEKKHFLEKLKF